MTNRDNEGQFELVLGNRQLLSGFFIVVILFAVFFAMGYIVGRNSSASQPKMAAAAPDLTSSSGVSVEPRPQAGPDAAAPTESTVSEAPPPAVTQPAQEPPPARRTERPPVAEPAAGRTYLQVAAVRKPDAEVVAEALKKKGFPALVAPSSTPELFRVLIGPYADWAALTRSKAQLEEAGFKSIVRK